MDRTPAPVSLAAARALEPPEGSRAAEVVGGGRRSGAGRGPQAERRQACRRMRSMSPTAAP